MTIKGHQKGLTHCLVFAFVFLIVFVSVPLIVFVSVIPLQVQCTGHGLSAALATAAN